MTELDTDSLGQAVSILNLKEYRTIVDTEYKEFSRYLADFPYL